MSIKTTQFTEVDVLTGTGTSTTNAATINTQTGVITTEALTTAAGATYTMTLTNSLIQSGSIVNVSVGKGTATAGMPVVAWVTPSTGTCVIILQNIHATNALNGTIKLAFSVQNVS
jgi:hypothetical protein